MDQMQTIVVGQRRITLYSFEDADGNRMDDVFLTAKSSDAMSYAKSRRLKVIMGRYAMIDEVDMPDGDFTI